MKWNNSPLSAWNTLGSGVLPAYMPGWGGCTMSLLLVNSFRRPIGLGSMLLSGFLQGSICLSRHVDLSAQKWLWQWWSWIVCSMELFMVVMTLSCLTMATVVIMLTTFTRVEDEKSEYALVLSLWIFTHHGICSVCYIYIYILYTLYILYIFFVCYILSIYIYILYMLNHTSSTLQPFHVFRSRMLPVALMSYRGLLKSKSLYFLLGGGKKLLRSTPLKINMEPEHDGFGRWFNDFPFPGVYSQVPCWSSGV